MSKIQKGEFPYGHFFKMISGKWKPYILVAIDYEGCIRFNSILKFWGEISSKVLYQNLRELEEDQLICRFTDPEKAADQTPEEDQIPEEKEERSLSQKKTDTMTA